MSSSVSSRMTTLKRQKFERLSSVGAEAFSAVDQESEAKMLSVLGKTFKYSTIFSLTHRLDDVLKIDTIMFSVFTVRYMALLCLELRYPFPVSHSDEFRIRLLKPTVFGYRR